MSLINDALKRAKDAQPKSPPPAPGPQLRPAERGDIIARGMGAIPFIIVAVIAFISFFLLWQSRQKSVESQPMVEAKPTSPVNPVPETKPPVQTVAVSTPKPVVNSPATQKPAPVAPVPVAIATTPVKLQAIFFAPGRSSAIISGKSVRAGDTVNGFRVAAITQSSATVVSAAETNVMTLQQ